MKSVKTRHELSAAIAERYRAADRPGKKAILDEFVKVTGYHRKHAIRIMNGKQVAEQQKPVGERIHQAAMDEALIVLWEAADRICGKRLKALLPTLVVAMERHGHLRLDETIRERAYWARKVLPFFLEGGNEALDPSQNAGVYDRDTALCHQIAHVAITQLVSDIPSHGLND